MHCCLRILTITSILKCCKLGVKMEKEHFYGRLIIKSKLTTIEQKQFENVVDRLPTIINDQCQRCRQIVTGKIRLAGAEKYCIYCQQLGRISEDDELWTINEPNDFNMVKNWDWPGKLTKPQMQVVTEILSHNQKHLVWAVTGAGKTEILFPIIWQGLKQRKRIAIAAPRIDVINELFPRFKRVFPTVTMCAMHGAIKDQYAYTQIVVCTTHQLLKFKAAFDLIIVDEVDAYPLSGNQMLWSAINNACKNNGRQIWLSATPTTTLLKQVRQISYLPLRFHNFLLPECKITLVNRWQHNLKRGKLPAFLIKCLKNFTINGLPFLIFVPTIEDTQAVLQSINKYFPNLKVMAVHSRDIERINKILALRQAKIQGLVTTLILERGVTFPDIDVIVLGAEHSNFTVTSLLQIIGRVGRKLSRPSGEVYFLTNYYCLKLYQVKKLIKKINTKAQIMGGRKYEL